ncbi:MAG TPA: histone-like nucleoid-structuring protein Lsr2 [Candidatus Nanopelagicales bacterium]
MRLSFDTDKDTLDGALAVLSAAYGVSLNTGTSSAAPRAAKTAAPRTRKAAARKTTARKTTARKTSARKATTRKTAAAAPARKRATKRPASRGGAPRTADVRAWAAGQGVKVSDRGRLSADLIAKYTAANS